MILPSDSVSYSPCSVNNIVSLTNATEKDEQLKYTIFGVSIWVRGSDTSLFKPACILGKGVSGLNLDSRLISSFKLITPWEAYPGIAHMAEFLLHAREALIEFLVRGFGRNQN